MTGANTEVGAGAVVRDSRLRDVKERGGATIIDSIVAAEGHVESHKCDTAGRVVVSGAAEPEVMAGACVRGCTLVNTTVGQAARVVDTWAKDVVFGPRNSISRAKVALTNTDRDVTITGPTEVSEAWLGRGTVIDRRGYYEGIFGNAFRQVKFNETLGRLEVTGTIELPHVSRYGVNTINSTNSGKLLPQPPEGITDFGPYRGLWEITLLNHEQIELGPCCWVAPWTKIIGQSFDPHQSDEELVNDRLTTYLMPFAIAGVNGPSSNGLVAPGELSVGYGPKRRKGAWVFTYAPDLVIRMVKRLHDALEPERKAVADTIVIEAIRAAIEMTRALAFDKGVDPTLAPGEQRRGWPRWIATTLALLTAHLRSGAWRFCDGEPVGWRHEGGRWTHAGMEPVLAIAGDALEKQIAEHEIFEFDDPVPPIETPLPSGSARGTGGQPRIAQDATVAADAFVGPGCVIGPGCEIESGARLWNSVLDHCAVGRGARVERSVLEKSSVGARSVVRSCAMSRTTLGRDSTADAGSLTDSTLAAQTMVSAFANISHTQTRRPAIMGGAFSRTQIDTTLMSMHMAGACRGLKALPTAVELDSGAFEVHAAPMIGGGAVIRGSSEKPIEMECSFIGSNSIIEPGCYVGFGCFVLGDLGPDDGLPPFTVSAGGGPGRHQIGAVLTSMPNMIFTHFIDWAFQALGPDAGPALAEIVGQSIEKGARAIEWELERRGKPDAPGPNSPYARYKSLPAYSEAQLAAGLANYRKVRDQGAWDMSFDGGKLVFASDKGRWVERGGGAFWEPA